MSKTTQADDFRALILIQTDDCVLWPHNTVRGYGYVQYEGKRQRVNRLACRLVHGEPPTPKHHAAHWVCGVSHCINPRHLRWSTVSENEADKVRHGTAMRGERHHKATMTDEVVLKIRERYAQRERKHARDGKNTQHALAAEFGVSRSAVREVLLGHTWTHLIEVAPR